MRKILCSIVLALAFVSMGRGQSATPAAVNPKDYTAYVVGYAHMDMAWLWRWEESIHDVMYNTFTNQIRLMDQNPDYTFAAGSGRGSRLHGAFLPRHFQGRCRRRRAPATSFPPPPAGCRWMKTSATANRWCGNSSTARNTARKNSATTFALPGSRTSSATPITMPQIAAQGGHRVLPLQPAP